MDRNYIHRVFSLLDCFSSERPDLGVREAARILQISSSAAGRLLAELRDEGILTQDPDSKTYSLGGRVIRWADAYNSSSDLRQKARPGMKEIFRQTNETVSLYAAEEFERVCVERFESLQTVRIVEQVGTRIHIYAGSGGKAILAFRTTDEIEQTLQYTVRTDPQMTDKEIERLKAELAEIRECGFAVSHGEWHAEASGIASPIFNDRGLPIGSISISGPSQRFQDQEKLDSYAKLLLACTGEISAALGWHKALRTPTAESDLS